MKLITRVSLAKKAGVSAQAINKALRAGHLKIAKDGKVNLLSRLTQAFLKEGARQRTQKKRKTKGKSTGKKKVKKKQVKDREKRIKQVLSQELINKILSGKYVGNLSDITKVDVDKIKVIKEINQIELKTRERRNELVDREMTQRVFAKIYGVDVSELKPIGTKLSTELAAIFGSNDKKKIAKANEKIDKEIYRALDHIKKIINKFLSEIEADEIK